MYNYIYIAWSGQPKIATPAFKSGPDSWAGGDLRRLKATSRHRAGWAKATTLDGRAGGQARRAQSLNTSNGGDEGGYLYMICVC